MILAGTMVLIALSSMILFHGNIVTGILMLLSALGIIACKLLFAKKLKKPILGICYAAGFLIFVVAALWGNGRISQYGFASYANGLSRIENQLEQGHYKEALSMAEKLRTEEGDSDVLCILEAKALIEDGDPSQARSTLNRMTEKDGAPYYLCLAATYDKEEDYQNECKCLIEGAHKNPADHLLNYRAGCMSVWQENYEVADTFLYQAITTNYDGNCFTPFMLALVRYERGYQQDAYALMSIAEEQGILEYEDYVKEDVVQWYLENKEAGNE